MQRIQRPESFGGSFLYLSAKRRSGIRFSHGDYWLLNWEIRQAIAEGGGHGFKERIRDEETKFILLCGAVPSESG